VKRLGKRKPIRRSRADKRRSRRHNRDPRPPQETLHGEQRAAEHHRERGENLLASSPTGPVNKSSSKARAAILLDHALARYGPRQRKRAPFTDDNNNNRLDTDFIAYPTEGYALSNGFAP